MIKVVANQEQWSKVSKELEAEYSKVQSYDRTIVNHIGDFKNLIVLDYGAGPAVFSNLLKGLGATVKVYDTSNEMREIAKEKLGRSAVFHSVSNIPDDYFNIVLCNLVLCIVDELEVINILKNLKGKVSKNGKIFIGFCNPKIYFVKETQLDYRFPTGNQYKEVHDYKKIKKEGNYEITEKHRSLDWYTDTFKEAELKVINVLYTPMYELNGIELNDFVIFELIK